MFTSSLTWFSRRTRLSDPVLPFLFSSSSWVLRAPAVFTRSLVSWGGAGSKRRRSCSCVNEASCLSHSRPKNTLISRKLQSQVPECLAKPCPPLPRWDVLTLVKVVFIPYLCVSVSVAAPQRSPAVVPACRSSRFLCTRFVVCLFRANGYI